MKRNKIKKRLIPRPSAPIADLVGFRLIQARQGRAVCEMNAESRHENTIGSIHGGILCNLADAAMGYAFLSVLRKGQTGVTVEFKINFLQPVFADEKLRAEAHLVFRGKSMGYLECALKTPASGLVAKASCTCKLLA